MSKLLRGLTSLALLAVLYGAAAEVARIYLPRRVWMGTHYIEDVELLPTYASLAGEALYLLKAGILLSGIAVTIGRVVAGFLIGTAVGLAAASAATADPRLAALVAPWATFLRFASPLALLPLYVSWFGFGEVARIAVIATGVGVVVFVGTLHGASQLPSVYRDSAASLGLSRWQTLRRVALPWAAPYIVSSLRVGLALAWTSVVVAELIRPSQPALGHLLVLASVYPRVPAMLTGILVIGALVLAGDALLLALHGRAARWMSRRDEHAPLL